MLALYKSGDKQLFSNYRPISLTPYSCKMLEHIIYKHIMQYLEMNNLLSNVQHWFRRGLAPAVKKKKKLFARHIWHWHCFSLVFGGLIFQGMLFVHFPSFCGLLPSAFALLLHRSSLELVVFVKFKILGLQSL